jgi:hypothetical protein
MKITSIIGLFGGKTDVDFQLLYEQDLREDALFNKLCDMPDNRRSAPSHAAFAS